MSDCIVPGCWDDADPDCHGVCAEHRRIEMAAVAEHDLFRQADLDDLWPSRIIEREDAAREARAMERRALMASVKPVEFSGDGTEYGCRQLADALNQLPHRAGESGRNNALNACAYRVGRLVAGGELDHDRARECLLRAGDALGIAKHETRSTVRSGMRAGMERPWVDRRRRAA